jgi:hypothetical protein
LLSEPGVTFVSLRLFSFLLHAMKAPWSWSIAFWAFCARLICGTLRRLFHIYEGSLGRIGNTAPSSSDVIPMGSKRFALQGIEYAFLKLKIVFRRWRSLRDQNPPPRPQKTYI